MAASGSALPIIFSPSKGHIVPKLLTSEDRGFLAELDGKLHYVDQRIHGDDHGYTNQAMTAEEMTRLLGIVEKKAVFLSPISLGQDNARGFYVAEVSVAGVSFPAIEIPRTYFLERQLPADYDSNRITSIVMAQKNVGLAEMVGVPTRTWRYDY